MLQQLAGGYPLLSDSSPQNHLWSFYLLRSILEKLTFRMVTPQIGILLCSCAIPLLCSPIYGRVPFAESFDLLRQGIDVLQLPHELPHACRRDIYVIVLTLLSHLRGHFLEEIPNRRRISILVNNAHLIRVVQMDSCHGSNSERVAAISLMSMLLHIEGSNSDETALTSRLAASLSRKWLLQVWQLLWLQKCMDAKH